MRLSSPQRHRGHGDSAEKDLLSYLETSFDQVNRVWTDHHFKFARLNYPLHLSVVHSKLGGPQTELHFLTLGWLQREPTKPFHLFHRSGHARHHVSYIQLNHFVACEAASVLNIDRDS